LLFLCLAAATGRAVKDIKQSVRLLCHTPAIDGPEKTLQQRYMESSPTYIRRNASPYTLVALKISQVFCFKSKAKRFFNKINMSPLFYAVGASGHSQMTVQR